MTAFLPVAVRWTSSTFFLCARPCAWVAGCLCVRVFLSLLVGRRVRAGVGWCKVVGCLLGNGSVVVMVLVVAAEVVEALEAAAAAAVCKLVVVFFLEGGGACPPSNR